MIRSEFMSILSLLSTKVERTSNEKIKWDIVADSIINRFDPVVYRVGHTCR